MDPNAFKFFSDENQLLRNDPFDQKENPRVTFSEVNGNLLQLSSTDFSHFEYFVDADGQFLPNIFVPAKVYVRPKVLNYEGREEFNLIEQIKNFGTDSNDPAENKFWISRVINLVFSVTYEKLFGVEEVEAYLENTLSCVGWHQYRSRLAACINDYVQIYDLKMCDWEEPLRHEFQRDVRCLEWGKNGILAVGCKKGVCLWRFKHGDVRNVLHNPMTDGNLIWMDFLTYPGHYPITTLSWSPNGRYLATGSASSVILIWDIALRKATPLPHFLINGVTQLKWSPNNYYLFGSDRNNVCRIWETRTWKSEKWEMLPDRCISATWNPDGNIIALAFANCPDVYFISYSGTPPELDGHFLQLENFSPFSNPETSEKYLGDVMEVAWDQTGNRFAVSFWDSAHVALYRVPRNAHGKTTNFKIHPIGLIRLNYHLGTPKKIFFKPQFDRGSLLTIAYADGRLSFIPLYFTKSY